MAVAVACKFVGERIARLRCLPLAATDRDICFVTGSSESRNNHVCLWQYTRSLSSSFSEEHPRQAEEPSRLSALNIPAAVTALAVNGNEILVGDREGATYALRPDEQGVLQHVSPLFDAHRDMCTDLTVSADHRAAAAYASGTVVWCGARGERPQTLREPDGATVSAVCFADSHSLATTSSTGKLRVWDVRSGSHVAMRADASADGGLEMLQCVACPQGQANTLVTGSSGGIVAVWDRRKPSAPVSMLKAHDADVWELRFHPQGSSDLFSCSEDGLLLHWQQPRSTSFSLGTGVQARNLVGSPSLGVNSVDVAGELVLCGTDNGAVALFTGWQA